MWVVVAYSSMWIYQQSGNLIDVSRHVLNNGVGAIELVCDSKAATGIQRCHFELKKPLG